MKEFWLWRFPSIKDGTFGVMLDDNLPFCVTLERPWVYNQKEISCIPDGNYTCRRIDSLKFGNTFEVTNILGRSEILFHKGNIAEDSHGCIILGEQYEPIMGKNGVVSSGKAFEEFLKRTEEIDEFSFHVRWIGGS